MTRPDPREDRVAALERRVSVLESRLDGGPPAGTARDDGVFWALEGLRARAPEPGAVLMTGAVTLPDERVAHWQQAATTEDLLGLDFTEHVEPLAALGHPVRLRILQHVLRGTASVHDLTETEQFGTSGQVYHHLRQLVSAGWLRAAGGGRYEVPVPRVVPLLTILMAVR